MNPLPRWLRYPFYVAALLLLSACATLSGQVDPPQMSVAGLQIVDATVFEQRYRIQLRIQNPNDFALPIVGMSYDLELNGQPFLRGVSNHAVTIPAYGQGVVEVDAVSTLFSFVRQIEELQRGQLESLTYSLQGKISLQNRLLKLPFDFAGELSLTGNESGKGA